MVPDSVWCKSTAVLTDAFVATRCCRLESTDENRGERTPVVSSLTKFPGSRSIGMLMGVIAVLCCCAGVADAGWFVPENRIAWQAWQRGDDAASLQHWDYSSKGIFGRATVLLKMGRLREAERGFRQALNAAAGLKPAYIASIWYNLGNCLYREGALQPARQAWRQALQYQPGHVKAAHNLALLEGLLKRRRKHEPNSSSSLSSAPKHKDKGGKQDHGDQQQAENGIPGADKSGKQSKTGEGNGGGEEEEAGMKQAEQAAASVRDSMDLFLRNRMAEKAAPAMPSRRGMPW